MRNVGLFLLLLNVISGLAIVYARHQERLAFIAMQDAQQLRDQLNIEWRQLLLEESTWSTHSVVEQNAREKLGMTVPDSHNVITLPHLSK